MNSSGLASDVTRDDRDAETGPVPAGDSHPARNALTDAELVDLALAGNQQAYRSLVERHQHAVFNLVARIVRDPALAEDVAQESFVKAFTHLDRFDARFKFLNWILRIAHNGAIDAVRRRTPRPEVSLEVQATDDGPRLEDRLVDPDSDRPIRDLHQQDVSRVMNQALAALRFEYREVLVLRHHQDLSYEEIAEVTGLPLGTVKSYLHRARAEMAAYLRRIGYTG